MFTVQYAPSCFEVMNSRDLSSCRSSYSVLSFKNSTCKSVDPISIAWIQLSKDIYFINKHAVERGNVVGYKVRENGGSEKERNRGMGTEE